MRGLVALYLSYKDVFTFIYDAVYAFIHLFDRWDVSSVKSTWFFDCYRLKANH